MQALQLSAIWSPRAGVAPGAHALSCSASDVWRYPELALVEVEPQPPGPGEVTVAVGFCGLCGTDTHCLQTDSDGWVRFSGPAQFPVVLGHEYAGVVSALGPGVSGLSLGEPVAAEGMLYCGGCEACRRGRFNQCASLRMTGLSAPGALVSEITVPARQLWSLGQVAVALGTQEALRRGALIEPISCSYNGIWVAGGGLTPGSSVLIFGCGPIGLGAVLLCRAAGAARVWAVDPIPERRALALACGADQALPPEASLAGLMAGAWGADLVVEAAGAAHTTLPRALEVLAPGGSLVYLGRTGGSAPVQLDALVTGAARIVGSRGHAGGGCYPALVRMLAAGVLDPSPMISATLPLSQAEAALRRSVACTDGKLLIDCSPIKDRSAP